MTLGEYYKRKRAHYSVGFSDAYDRDLKRLFTEAEGPRDRRVSAAAFLRRHRREIRRMVAKWTGEYQLTLNEVLDQMIGRCQELQLVADGPERNLVLDFAIMLTVHGMNYLYEGREWHAM
jgi:predicted aminopeptidase